METSTPNVLSCEGPDPDPISPRLEALSWVLLAVGVLIGIIGAISNSLVVYFATYKSMTGTMRHLNKVVIYLALSDFLIGTLASPLQFVFFKMGETCN